MAGAKRRSYKKKGVSRRRKSGYTKRKSTKKPYKRRRATKAKRTVRKPSTKRRYRKSTGPSLAEMAFVVSQHHPDAMAVENAQTLKAASESLFGAAFQDINEEKTSSEYQDVNESRVYSL